MTAAALAETPVSTRTASPYRLTFVRLLHSEWIKVASLRSTWWSLAISAALTIGISLLIAASAPEGFTAVNVILLPTQFTMLVAGILGAMVITGEYSTGMIRSTLTAAPRRGSVLPAKAIIVAALIAVTTAITYAIAIAATAPMLGDRGIDWSDPAVSAVPLAYGVLSMVVFALIGLGWGFIIRNGAGAIATTVGLLFVMPLVVNLFSLFGEAWQWITDLGQYLPMIASQTVTSPNAGEIDGFGGALVALIAWALAGLLGGWAVLASRDA